jgi:hypothetical protein
MDSDLICLMSYGGDGMDVVFGTSRTMFSLC